MYWIYNVLLIFYWIGLIPVILYRLAFEDGFYERIKQSAGYMPATLLKKIEGRRAIWIHAASVGEIVATSPLVKEIKREFPEAVVVVSVVTATGHAMAHRIIPEAEGIIFFPLDLPYLTRKILHIIKPIAILLVETEIWPNFLRIAESEKIPVMMVNGRISDRSMKRYRYISAFTREMLSSIERFCMQSNFDAEYIAQLGANPDEITVTGNMKYDQTYATVSEEEKQALLDEFGFGHNHPIIVAGSTHKGEDEAVFESFKQVLVEYPNARLLIAPREIYRGHDVQTLAKRYGLEDIIFVGGSLVKTGGHNILEPAAHGKPIIVGPHMFNFKEIFNLLHSRHACEQVKNQKDLTTMILHLCKHPELAKEMGQNCLDIIRENRGATRRNTQELRQLFESHHIIP
ncbi:MAG: glycosyltransferase N-terminal domain-containing protein [Veillonella sp.]|nr:glycosyltransferase N-terminal domain-containing protein [Veillonella sp.]